MGPKGSDNISSYYILPIDFHQLSESPLAPPTNSKVLTVLALSTTEYNPNTSRTPNFQQENDMIRLHICKVLFAATWRINSKGCVEDKEATDR